MSIISVYSINLSFHFVLIFSWIWNVYFALSIYSSTNPHTRIVSDQFYPLGNDGNLLWQIDDALFMIIQQLCILFARFNWRNGRRTESINWPYMWPFIWIVNVAVSSVMDHALTSEFHQTELMNYGCRIVSFWVDTRCPSIF